MIASKYATTDELCSCWPIPMWPSNEPPNLVPNGWLRWLYDLPLGRRGGFHALFYHHQELAKLSTKLLV